jgi:hypothetical protein
MNKKKVKFLVTATIAAKFDAVKDASVKAYYQFGKTPEAAERAKRVSDVHSEAFKGFVDGDQFAVMANAERELKQAGLLK